MLKRSYPNDYYKILMYCKLNINIHANVMSTLQVPPITNIDRYKYLQRNTGQKQSSFRRNHYFAYIQAAASRRYSRENKAASRTTGLLYKCFRIRNRKSMYDEGYV